MSRKTKPKRPMASISVTADCHTKLQAIAESLNITLGELVTRMCEREGIVPMRYQPVKPPRTVRRYVSAERRALGEMAGKWGFR